ncbi:hypothetical protein [Amaricoccus tamworthensis]|uniref:hypothetical protein n=1 Tax=Amaricoccus tamworthensis TaxID=57002 RepID=UPI003C7D2D35
MTHTKGALVQYGDTFLGPIPNLLVFQYNVEELDRQFAIQRRSTDDKVPARQLETHRAHAAPVESFTLNLKFDASDDLDQGDGTARLFGVGPQLAALEKMVNPDSNGALLGAVVDAVGSLLGGGKSPPTRSIPPEQLPKLIFVGGLTRILPVEITAFRVGEKLFNSGLAVIRAEVTLGLEVVTFPPDTDDLIGVGATEYLKTLKDAQAVLNLGRSISDIPEIIGF